MTGLVSICAEDGEMNDEEYATFRKLAAGIACNLDGARIQLEESDDEDVSDEDGDDESKPKESTSRASTPLTTTSAERILYTAGTIDDLLAQASRTLNKMAAAFMRVSGCIDLTEINPHVGYDPSDDVKAFPVLLAEAAATLQASDLELSQIREAVRTARAEPASALESPAPKATTEPLYGLDDIGCKIIPLRDAVDIAITNIEGIVNECRESLDRACAMHAYASGNSDGGKWDAEENIDAEFNDAMATAAGALKCLLSYVDNIRPDAAAKARKQAEAAEKLGEESLSHAAEE